MLVKSTDRTIGPSQQWLPAKRRLRAEVCHDFEAFLSAHAVLGKYAPSPIFNLNLSNVSRRNAFWVRALDEDDRVVGIQAVRHIRIDDSSLHAYLRKHCSLFRPGDLDIDPRKFELRPNALDSLSGRSLCYQGELWLAPSHRNQGLAGPFVAEGIFESVARWDPDLIFGILMSMTSNMRYVRAIGYADLEEQALVWRDRSGRKLREESLTWCDRSSMSSAIAARGRRSIMSREIHEARPKQVA